MQFVLWAPDADHRIELTAILGRMFVDHVKKKKEQTEKIRRKVMSRHVIGRLTGMLSVFWRAEEHLSWHARSCRSSATWGTESFTGKICNPSYDASEYPRALFAFIFPLNQRAISHMP